MNRMAVLGCIGTVFLTGAVYGASVIKNEFVEWDDGLLILNNPIIQGLNLNNIKEAFLSYDPELYIPLTFLSYQLDYEIWGYSPVGFHLTNLLLHIGNSLLVVWFLKRLGWQWAMFGGALFAIHPLNTEAVVWASARKDVLMGFFFLLSLNLYMQWNHSCHGEPVEPRSQNTNGSTWYYASLVTFVFACLAKVTAVMLPAILLLLDWKHGRQNLKEKIPYFLISILFILIALFGKAGSHGLWWEKVLIGAKATMFYLQKLFWPTGLSVLYPYTEKISISNPDLLIPLVFVCAITLIVGYMFWHAPRSSIWSEVGLGWFFFLLLLLPSFTNFAKGQDILKDVYFASDRYAYLASIGIIYFVGCALHKLTMTKKVPYTIGLFGVIGLLGFLSYHQSFVWQTTESLFTNVVQYYPNAHVAQNNLGSLYYRREEVDRAIIKYKESLAVRPNATAFFNLGVIYMDSGYPAIAREAFHQALKLNPGDVEAKEKLSLLGM